MIATLLIIQKIFQFDVTVNDASRGSAGGIQPEKVNQTHPSSFRKDLNEPEN